MDDNKTGAALRLIRQAAGMTLEQVSNEAGISVSYLSRVENGVVTPTDAWVSIVAVAIGHHMAKDAA